ncbi:MAG TPA: tripartite tricarboxylate transporter substrate binding protein [Burkholderiales bacterium]|nr:tripartite tricarboxylate transporter substrate binding protein [Burkholderiales bacterium]
MKALPAAVAAALALMAGVAHAQNYPARPVRMIVPFTPGGSTDLYARTLSPRLGDALGQQVVVDNRAGAGGALGADLAAKAPPDGYTIWIGQTANLAIGPALRKKSPYDPVRDFAPITMVQRASSVFVVSASSPLKSLKDLIALAKKSPGVTYGSAGVGTAGHINGFLVARMAGIELLHVPYKGASPAMLDLQAGRIATMATSIGSSAGLIKQGKIRAIATTGARRAPALPDVPTVAEQGVTGYDIGSWHAVLAPAKTPAPIVARLNKELVAILNQPDIRDKLSHEGGEVMPTTPDEAAAYIRAEVGKWAKLLKDANIPVE